MRPRQDDDLPCDDCFRQGAKNLCLLTANDVWHLIDVLTHQSRDNGEPRSRHAHQRRSDRFESRRTPAIGRLDPALTAADHSGCNQWYIVGQLTAAENAQRVGKSAASHPLYPQGSAAHADDVAMIAERVRARRTGAPIDGDQADIIHGGCAG